MIVADAAKTQVLQVQGSERLEELAIGTLHMQLQGVGRLIVLAEECLTDLGNPLVGIFVEVAVCGLSCPHRDIVQIDDVVVCAAIDERT